MRERQKLETSLAAVRELENGLGDAIGLLEMAESDNDTAMIADAERSIADLHKRAEALRLQSMLSGEADANDSYLEIHAGAGGTEIPGSPAHVQAAYNIRVKNGESGCSTTPRHAWLSVPAATALIPTVEQPYVQTPFA